jgi:hypothetical protein
MFPRRNYDAESAPDAGQRETRVPVMVEVALYRSTPCMEGYRYYSEYSEYSSNCATTCILLYEPFSPT